MPGPLLAPGRVGDLVLKAVIPAAGAGTRFLPLTKNSPKEMLPLLDKPAIQYVVEEAVASGCTDILIVTGRGKRAIEDHFDRAPELEHFLHLGGNDEAVRSIQAIADLADIHYVRQKEPLGLGHAILCAEKHVGNEPFAVLLGDDIVFSQVPCTKQLVQRFEDLRHPIVAVERIERERSPFYGIAQVGKAVGERTWRVDSLVEKPLPEDAPSNLGILGRYILTPSIFNALRDLPRGKKGEIQLTDGLQRQLDHEPVFAYEFEGRRFDLGSKMEWLKANVEVALMRLEYRREFGEFLRRLMPIPTIGEKVR